jgi:hypothetical protein
LLCWLLQEGDLDGLDDADYGSGNHFRIKHYNPDQVREEGQYASHKVGGAPLSGGALSGPADGVDRHSKLWSWWRGHELDKKPSIEVGVSESVLSFTS